MTRWKDATFIFISTNARHDDEGVEALWLDVMEALSSRGATVRLLALSSSETLERASERGIAVDVYTLDAWNVIRARSRLRKYLRRYGPVAAHSTGLEADLMLRWAARKIPGLAVVHTLSTSAQGTRRRRPIEALMRRFDELGMRSAAAVFVEDEDLLVEVRSAGVPPERVLLESTAASLRPAVVERHLRLYQDLMAR